MKPREVVKSWPLLLLLLTACGPTGDESGQNVDNGGTNNVVNNVGTSNQTPNNQTPNNQTPNNQTPNNQTPNNQTPNNQTPNNQTPNNDNTNCPLPAPFDEGASYTDIPVPAGGNISQALTNAVPGTRLVLAPGTHMSEIFASGVRGTADSPIAIVGEDGAVISGGTTGMQLSDAAYLVIENLTFQGATANGLNIDDGGDYSTPAHHVIIRDVTVRDVGDGGNQDCIKLSGLDDFLIEGVDVSGCSGQSIDMVGCHDGAITANTIHDTASGVQAKGGTADVLIHRNWFESVEGRGINAGGSTGLEFFRPIDAPHEGARIRAYANVFVDVGATSGAPIAYVGCDACEFVNNTIVRPQTWVARILQESTDARFVPSRDGLFANNIVVFESSVLRTFVNVGADTAPETFTFRNNVWWDLDDPGFSGPNLSGGIPAEQDGMVADPGFAVTGSDFSIPASSPAAQSGADAPEVPDFAGNCFGAPPSSGAYQAQ